MSPITHLFASWVVATKTTDNRRDRRLVALSGLLPDIDGAGIVVDFARQACQAADDFWFYQKYHHLLLHGVFGALAIALALAFFARARVRVFVVCFFVAHLHLVCDLVGSRGPTPLDLWPIHYLGPFSHAWTWVWKSQWGLNAWPNQVITFGLLAWCLLLAVRHGNSPVGVFHERADAVFVRVLRGWLGRWIKRDPGLV